MADLDGEEPVSDISDSSFVILGQGSLPVQTNEKSTSLSLSTTTNNKYTVSDSESSNANINYSFEGSIFSDESIQKKLNELVKENYQLKETLSQNNLAIKSQLDTFFMWQQEVLKTHQNHKQKFLETKELILKLRAENISLKKQLEEFLLTTSGNAGEIYSLGNKKSEVFEKANKHKKMYNDLTEENKKLNTEILKLSEELQTAKSEILKLNSELEDLGRDNTYLKQRSGDFNKNSLDSVTHGSLPNSEAHVQISNLLKQLDEEKSKVLKLKEYLKETKLNTIEALSTKLSTTDELNQHIENLNDMNVSIDMQNQRFSSLQSWVSLAEETLKENKIHAAVECNLICELKELKSHLNQEENISREKQETLQELRKKFSVLLDDYKAIQLELKKTNNDTDIQKFREEISILSTKLETKDNELKLKVQECSNLKQENDKLNLRCEEISKLNAQVEIYESMVNEEQAARKKLVGEKEELVKKVQLLQYKVKTLQNNGSKNDSETSHFMRIPSERQFTCPECCFSFEETVFWEHSKDCVNVFSHC